MAHAFAAVAAVGLKREAALTAVGGENDDAAAGPTAAASVVGGAVVRIKSVGTERRCAAECVGANNDDAAAGRAAAGLIVAIRVIARACAAAAAHGDAIDGGGKNRTAFSADTQVGIPRVSAKTSGAAVAAASSARVLIVGCWIAIGATTACIARRAARAAAIGAGRTAGIVGRGLQVSSAGFNPQRRSGDPFTFHRIDAIFRNSGVSGRSSVKKICNSTSRATVKLHSRAAAEAHSVDRDGRAVESQRARSIEDENSAGGTIPGERGRRSGCIERGGGVLRHHNHLISALPRGGGSGRGMIGKHQPAARPCTGNWNGPPPLIAPVAVTNS